MNFKHEELGVKFEIPEPLTLRHLEIWEKGRLDAMEAGARTVVSLRWLAARLIVTNWECEALPDPKMNKDAISGEQLRVIAWVGLEVERYVQGLLSIPKARSGRRPSQP